MTTTANTTMIRSAPISGLTARIGAASTPASPASAMPKPKTGVTQRPTSMPNARVSSGRSVAARTTMPTRVRASSHHTATQSSTAKPKTNTRYAGKSKSPRFDRAARARPAWRTG